MHIVYKFSHSFPTCSQSCRLKVNAPTTSTSSFFSQASPSYHFYTTSLSLFIITILYLPSTQVLLRCCQHLQLQQRLQKKFRWQNPPRVGWRNFNTPHNDDSGQQYHGFIQPWCIWIQHMAFCHPQWRCDWRFANMHKLPQMFDNITNFDMKLFDKLCKFVCPIIQDNVCSTCSVRVTIGRLIKLTPEQHIPLTSYYVARASLISKNLDLFISINFTHNTYLYNHSKSSYAWPLHH